MLPPSARPPHGSARAARATRPGVARTTGPAAGLATGLATGLAAALAASFCLVPTATAQAAPRLVQAHRPFGSGSMGWEQESAHPAVGLQARTATSEQRTAMRVKGIPGIDVSAYQGTVNWSYYRSIGKRFVYVKATEGTSYRNSHFGRQYAGAYRAGLYHGAYHFASPNGRSGAAQADYFVAHGGRWTRDGHTLPGVLDIEYNPYGSTCYGLSKTKMVRWIRSFTTEYKRRTTRDAVIYSTTNWWSQCTGNTSAFSHTNPLWIARYARSAGTLPRGWSYYTFWQYNGTSLDQDTFNGSATRLRVLARG